MTEASLKIDSLGKNIEYKNMDAKIRQIYNLILMKPGTDPLNPEKGCDARSYYYQFNDDNVLRNLETKINDQIRIYTPYTIQSVMCKAIRNREGNYILHIMVSLLNDVTVAISTNGEASTLNLLNK